MSAEKKKICALTTISKTMDWFVVDTMRAMAKEGFEVTLVCDMDEAFIERNSDFATCIPVKMARGVDPVGAIRGIRAFLKIFKENKFDVIQYSTPNAALYASVAGWLCKIPRRVYCQWGIRYVTFGGLKRFIFKTLEKITCRFSTHVKGQSPKNRQFAIDEGLCKADKISVIGIGGTVGVDLNEFDISRKAQWRAEIREKYGVREDEFVYGYVGRLNVDKGVNELITAFRSMKGAKLFLVGMLDDKYGPAPENLRFAEECPDIIMTGDVPPKEVCRHLAAMDILVHPTYREGFGKVIQEGIAMALPVITTDIPGPSEVIEDGISGVLVPAKDAEALAKEMTALREDKERMKLYSAGGRARAEKYFERSMMIGNIIADYKKLLGIEDDRNDESDAADGGSKIRVESTGVRG